MLERILNGPIASRRLVLHLVNMLKANPSAVTLVGKCREALALPDVNHRDACLSVACQCLSSKELGEAMSIASPRQFWSDLQKAGFVEILMTYFATFDSKSEVPC